MELRKTIRKIMALGVGATMMGATILSASAAADLATYPDPFVKDGKFNAIVVVGDAAASSDVIGSVDVATSMQYASRVRKEVTATGGSTVTATGDSWKVGTSSKSLEMSEYRDATLYSTGQEEIRNISTFIGVDELGVLADGTFKNDKGDFKYKQYLYFDETASPGQLIPRSVVYTDNPDTDVSADFFYVPDGKKIARYKMEFTSSAQSSITDSTGSTDTTGTYLWNFEGQSLTLLGKEYSIVKARRVSATGNSLELTLMGGAVKDIMQEGETKTYTIGGKDYEVSLVYTGSTSAKFTINGESTDSLQEGSTDTLADGTQMGIRDILYQDFAGGVHQAEFYLGAEKIVLKDTVISDAITSTVLSVGNDDIDNADVIITGTDDNTTFRLDTIQIDLTADQDVYVPAGGKLSDALDQNGGLMAAWDIEYAGIAPVSTEKTKITGSSTQYNLEFMDGAGSAVKLPLLYTSGTTVVKLGDNNDELILVEGVDIVKNDYFVISDMSQKHGERFSYALRYIGASKSTSSNPTIKFKNVGSSETLERSYSAQIGAAFSGTADADIKIGGATYNVWNTTEDTTADATIQVDLNGNGVLNSAPTPANANNINITTKGGAVISIQGLNSTGGVLGASTLNTSDPTTSPTSGTLLVNVETVDADDYDSLAPSGVGFTLSATLGELDAAEATVSGNLHYVNPEGETNVYYTYTSLGTKVKFDQPTSSPASVEVDYPQQQALPQVFLTTPGVTISQGEASSEGAIVYYETSQIEVGAAKLASEVTNVAAQNIIVVGGPCANAVASVVMGNPADCTAGFEDGKAMIKLYEQSTGNVALLVAGWSAMDTRRAARVLANYATWQDAGKLKGTEVEIAGTSFTDITVSAPTPVVVETPVEEETPAEEETA